MHWICVRSYFVAGWVGGLGMDIKYIIYILHADASGRTF
jgi:hypothetical protein